MIQIMPPRIGNTRNANANNANVAPPFHDHEVSNAKFKKAIQMLSQSATNKNNSRVQDHVNSNDG